MKTHKKVTLVILILLLCLLSYKLVDTFAKYRSSIQESTEIAIARWNILVNSTSIQNSQTFTIQPVFPGNSHIASGIIAPTAEGYFTLNFDYTDVDVSFRYEVEVAPSLNSSVSDLIVTGYKIGNGQVIDFDPSDGITNTIYLNSGSTNETLTIYIKWDDSASASMNNIDDTAATVATANDVLLDVTVSFIQVTS